MVQTRHINIWYKLTSRSRMPLFPLSQSHQQPLHSLTCDMIMMDMKTTLLHMQVIHTPILTHVHPSPKVNTHYIHMHIVIQRVQTTNKKNTGVFTYMVTYRLSTLFLHFSSSICMIVCTFFNSFCASLTCASI